ncbi:MAG: hypothetical protein HQL26_09755 [Candidatus Omnitrophica bacterium]|nr:hypothetical protein [Candidatus Omnitrophota bacterium]
MDFFTGIVMIVFIVGAIAAAALGIVLLIVWWYLIIPFLCTWFGGGIGFIFGLGLDAIIWGIICIFTSISGAASQKEPPKDTGRAYHAG